MAAFLDLPQEVRTMIYEYCLVFSKEIIPYTTYYESEEGLQTFPNSDDKLCMALLEVNTLIRVEAREVFYGKNFWRLSYQLLSFDPIQQREVWMSEKSYNIWKANMALFRHINVSFDFRDCHPNAHVENTNYMHSILKSSLTHDERAKRIHDERRRKLACCWVEKMAGFLRKMNLKSLRIGMENCYCPCGCCRDVKRFCKEHEYSLVQWYRHPEPSSSLWRFPTEGASIVYPASPLPTKSGDVKVTMVGLLSEDEKAYVHGLGLGCEECPLVGNFLDTKACTRDKGQA
ncbi:hypothetical protein MMC28_003583 [Mycoblastus sanguinarius]|nr:hypothetical protein [Mycoblastus sanguinarius]